jgi:tetratricopeptide (TPR) repeat protein
MSDEAWRPPRRSRARRKGRSRAIGWGAIFTLLALVILGAKPLYHFLKAKRAGQFAAAGDALVQAGKWSDAVKEYRAALQLDPLGYPGLEGAARLASRADRPEAINLWEQVIKLPQCTTQDRQEYAGVLIKSDRLSLAEKVIDRLLKSDPDTKTLELASRYSRKIGDTGKAVEFARLAVTRAPQDDAARFQLAELLAQSNEAGEQAEAHKVLWELAGKGGAYKKPAIEALARAPELSSEERERVLRALEQLSSKDLTDDLLAADVRMQIQPDDAARIYDETIAHWRDSKVEQLVDLARWLNAHQQAERVLTLFPVERVLQNNALLLARLDALAILQRWTDIDDTLSRPEVTLDPSVIESFRARTAQERGATLDAEVHWNHAVSLAGNDPFKLRFVASFAERSRADGVALKAYEQLARFPEQAWVAYRGAERVGQKTGNAAVERAAAEKIAASAPEDPNAADQLVYLNLLLEKDIEKNLATAKKLAEKYPNRLSYRVTAALGYLREHDPGSALAQFNGPVPIDWKQAQPAWRAVYAATLLANERNDEAREIIRAIPLARLSSQELALIEPAQEAK